MDLFIQQIVKQFSQDRVCEITVLGNGLINDTYWIKTEEESFVLQRLNTQVFPNPELVMENLVLFVEHIEQKSAEQVKLKIPLVLETLNYKTFYIDEQSNYWRALEFFENTESRESISDLNEAKQVGFALGHFHQLLSDKSVESFHDTLPGFHITPVYYQHYQNVERNYDGIGDAEKLHFCRNFIAKFKKKINVLEQARSKGLINEKIIHGDPKFNNFLFEKNTDKIISLIDLDTVKPGLVHYDIGDCLRSCCHNTQSNTFDLKICDAILKNYLQQTESFFTDQDYQFLYPAIQLMPFELGLRFFTDYREGNRYFKIDLPEQNLDRAISQFYLCESVTEQEEEIKEMISGFSVNSTR